MGGQMKDLDHPRSGPFDDRPVHRAQATREGNNDLGRGMRGVDVTEQRDHSDIGHRRFQWVRATVALDRRPQVDDRAGWPFTIEYR